MHESKGKPVGELFDLQPGQAAPPVHQGLTGAELSGVAIAEISRRHERHDL
jgi:hypothetical protein